MIINYQRLLEYSTLLELGTWRLTLIVIEFSSFSDRPRGRPCKPERLGKHSESDVG